MTESFEQTIYNHAAESLELPQVIEQVASYCMNEGARTSLRRLQFMSDPQQIEVALSEIEQARHYREIVADIAVGDTSCRHAIVRARDRNESLTEMELLTVASAESGSAKFKREFKSEAEQYPLLDTIVSTLQPQMDVVTAIEAAIDVDGNVRDSASPKLKDIRKQIHHAIARVRGEVERLSKKAGKGAFPTLFGNRQVVLIPRDAAKRRDGVAHSTSQSGESLYFEPFSLLELNNALEALLSEETAEVLRILRDLSARVIASSPAIMNNLDTTERLDALRAKAIFSESLDCITPTFSTGGQIDIRQGKHPLLVRTLRGAGREKDLVPLDLKLPRGERVMVITGPNAGGKTVTLKTVGLLVLMFQNGLQVPCSHGSEFPVFANIFVDIGDEQSIESSLSTFTSHLKHLDRMCRAAGKSSLCLIDEIGDGTDPDEGASLAIAALERLLSSRVAVIATTHYGKVKMFALQKDGVQNASMAFEDEHNRPLFRLLHGLAGRSRGIETAKRCGFDEEVVERAKYFIGERAFRLESLLSELEANHLALQSEREAITKQSESLRKVIERYTEKEKKIDSSEAKQSEIVRRETKEMLENARREIEHIVKEIRESGAKKERIREGHKRIRKMIKKTEVPKPAQRAISLSVGDRVSLNPSGEPEGEVIDVSDDSATVEIAGKRINIKRENLYKPKHPRESRPKRVSWDVSVEPLASSTVDVRGLEREAALQEVDRFLDRAVLSGLHEVTIIHGVGEGILLHAIRGQLTGDVRVQELLEARAFEGGAGVTIVKLN
jgi:DNA mismatch repair protein MutS2